MLLELENKVDRTAWGLPTALGEPTDRDDVEVARICMEFGADPENQVWGMVIPLAIAVEKSNPDMLNAMLGVVGGVDVKQG